MRRCRCTRKCSPTAAPFPRAPLPTSTLGARRLRSVPAGESGCGQAPEMGEAENSGRPTGPRTPLPFPCQPRSPVSRAHGPHAKMGRKRLRLRPGRAHARFPGVPPPSSLAGSHAHTRADRAPSPHSRASGGVFLTLPFLPPTSCPLHQAGVPARTQRTTVPSTLSPPVPGLLLES